jgi:hypothetical protein
MGFEVFVDGIKTQMAPTAKKESTTSRRQQKLREAAKAHKKVSLKTSKR